MDCRSKVLLERIKKRVGGKQSDVARQHYPLKNCFSQNNCVKLAGLRFQKRLTLKRFYEFVRTALTSPYFSHVSPLIHFTFNFVAQINFFLNGAFFFYEASSGGQV